MPATPGSGQEPLAGGLLTTNRDLKLLSCPAPPGSGQKLLTSGLFPVAGATRQWAEATDRKALTKQERLESELHGYKTNLIKESIRMGHNDLGDFFYERGDLQDPRGIWFSRDYRDFKRATAWHPGCLGAGGACSHSIKACIRV
eukprot:1140715-Pelagomonas_calceolata.AAC.2